MINSLKEFSELLKICRKQGVQEVEVAGVKIKFSPVIVDEPVKAETSKEVDKFIGEQISDEDLMFWSSRAEGEGEQQ